jgi:hypothetical protein
LLEPFGSQDDRKNFGIFSEFAAGQAKQQNNPEAFVACIKQLDRTTRLSINSASRHKGHR